MKVPVNEAGVALLRGDLTGAEAILQSTLDTARETGDIRQISHSYLKLARIAQQRGDLSTAYSVMLNAIHWYEHCGDLSDAVQCFNDLAAVAEAADDMEHVAWCVGAAEGAFADLRMSRMERESREHQARLERVLAKLGEPEWQEHYGRGRSMSPYEILAEVRSRHP